MTKQRFEDEAMRAMQLSAEAVSYSAELAAPMDDAEITPRKETCEKIEGIAASLAEAVKQLRSLKRARERALPQQGSDGKVLVSGGSTKAGSQSSRTTAGSSGKSEQKK